ncbi:MAG: ABC transporter ATP-binding protein [Promethearchaeota archaeon]|jgi:oligopeptide/dipeptide ABC transporter ATP-binding protein
MLFQDYNPMAMSILILIIISLVMFSITIFIIFLSNKLQIITFKLLLSLESFAPGFLFLLILFFIQLETFASSFISLLLISFAVIIQVVSTIILRRYTYKKIDYPKIDKIYSHEKGKSLLQVKDLKVYYPLLKGMLKRQIGVVKAVDGISFEIKTGETIGLVGESGCGKTTVAKAILGFVDIEDGKIQYGDEEIPTKFPMELRRKIQIVFQDPDASLNPRMKVVNIIAEALKNLMGITDKKEVRKFILSLMDQVSLKREHMDRYPHEFSGGQKQRIVIARALVCNPELIILDEPTSALDVSVQAQILNLLKDLQEDYGYGFLFITHDLSVVNHIADRVAVMYLGKFVEFGSTEQIFSNPIHPYTQALLSSRAEFDPEDQVIRFVIDGEVPSPINPPSGCAFNPRCTAETRTKECENLFPHKMEIEEGHYVWCCSEMLSKYHLKSTTN